MFTTLALMLSACSIDASVQHLLSDLKILSSPKQAHGITSGSAQMKQDLTSGGYKISTSVGVVGATNSVNNSLLHQTVGGYKVYSTLQGVLVSQ